MFRVVNRNVIFKKNLFTTLNNIFGLGTKTTLKLCQFIGVLPETKIKHLPADHLSLRKLRIFFRQNEQFLESNLKRSVEMFYTKWINIKSYRGSRHALQFPARGQRTHTNANTKKRMSRTGLMLKLNRKGKGVQSKKKKK